MDNAISLASPQPVSGRNEHEGEPLMINEAGGAATEIPARMVCEVDRGIYVRRTDEPPRYVPAGTKIFIDAWAGAGWYRGRLWDSRAEVFVHAGDLGLSYEQ